MNLYPAIDLFQGKVVRLSRGDFAKETVYSHQPEEQASEWEKQGARWLHVVDLEGAKSGEPANLSVVLKIRQRVGCKIQFGGGMRHYETVKKVLDAGIDRVVIGTKALDEAFFSKLIRDFGPRIAVGLDARAGMVQTDGWLKESGVTVQELLKQFNDYGLGTVIYTDIQKDGMLEGPNFEGLNDVLRWTRASVILSGGIASVENVEACAQIKAQNFEGVIIGKALYEKRFTLNEAVRYQS